MTDKFPDETREHLNRLDQGVPHYDRLGLPIPLGEWAARIEDPEYKILQQTQVGDVWVSTVWLGLDHNFRGEGPPIIFETMCFYGYRGDRAIWQHRYSTEDEARAGHEAACQMVRDGVIGLNE